MPFGRIPLPVIQPDAGSPVAGEQSERVVWDIPQLQCDGTYAYQPPCAPELVVKNPVGPGETGQDLRRLRTRSGQITVLPFEVGPSSTPADKPTGGLVLVAVVVVGALLLRG